ncbi:MAG: AraC family transcriptional regulator [Synergistaceae bacterium]|nr:AraC family transcriptional regulator [Synergistaceae bacterium]
MSKISSFNSSFVSECAKAYSLSTGIGCSVFDRCGAILFECGFGCGSCKICAAAGLDRTKRFGVNAYDMSGNGKFGGRYIYICQMGLVSISSPVQPCCGGVANITAGPFLMFDVEEFIALDLRENFILDGSKFERVVELLRQVPNITPDRVSALSNLLFLTVSRMGDISVESQELETLPRDFEVFQEQVPEKILKNEERGDGSEYPVITEKKLMASIANSDRPRVQKLLNDLLGHILFSSGEDFDRKKTETYELLVMISREAIGVGVPRSKLLQMNRMFWWHAQSITSIDEFCVLLSDVVNKYVDNIFDYSDKKNSDVIYKAIQYMYQNYSNKITLEDVAKAVYMTPAYFCKIFKKEVGCNFNMYLNQLRIEKSKQFLLQHNGRIADIISMVGFEDQSYFTKVFKRVEGVSPKHFLKSAEAP